MLNRRRTARCATGSRFLNGAVSTQDVFLDARIRRPGAGDAGALACSFNPSGYVFDNNWKSNWWSRCESREQADDLVRKWKLENDSNRRELIARNLRLLRAPGSDPRAIRYQRSICAVAEAAETRLGMKLMAGPGKNAEPPEMQLRRWYDRTRLQSPLLVTPLAALQQKAAAGHDAALAATLRRASCSLARPRQEIPVARSR